MLGRFGSVLLTAFLAGPSTAAPMGMALGLSPVLAVFAVVAGAAASFVIALFATDWIKARWPRKPRDKPRSGKAAARARAILTRFGPAGLGLIGPALIGTWVSAAVGAAFGLARWRLLAWLVTGALVWATILVAASGALLGWLFG